MSSEIAAVIDPSTLPRVTVDADVAELSSNLAGSGAQDLAVTLAENLETETQALLGADKSLLAAVDYGNRLTEMRRRIDVAVSTGETAVAHYVFTSLRLSSVVPLEGQRGLSLRFEARGTMEEITYDADGNQAKRATSPFALTFVLSQPTGDRWLIVSTLPLAVSRLRLAETPRPKSRTAPRPDPRRER